MFYRKYRKARNIDQIVQQRNCNPLPNDVAKVEEIMEVSAFFCLFERILD